MARIANQRPSIEDLFVLHQPQTDRAPVNWPLKNQFEKKDDSFCPLVGLKQCMKGAAKSAAKLPDLGTRQKSDGEEMGHEGSRFGVPLRPPRDVGTEKLEALSVHSSCPGTTWSPRNL